MKDKSIYDKSLQAFVSHVRAYSKHECSLLFQVKDLPLGQVANCYGLLKLPKMPEINAQHREEFKKPEKEIDFNLIPYKDKQKDASRKRKLEVFKETGEWMNKVKKRRMKQTESWEQSKQTKLDKKERRVNRKEKKNQIDKGLIQKTKKSKRRKSQLTKDEMEELLRDVALCKKLKNKKISQNDFDKEFGIEED